LAELYAAACLAPDPAQPSLLVQVARAAGAAEDLARRQRRELPWDAVPLDPVPGAAGALDGFHRTGARLGVLANQPASARADLERAGLLRRIAPEDVWLSEEVGLAKPDPAFFRLALGAWGLAPERVTYVGDRPDNDVAPAKALGLRTIRVLTGPHAAQRPRSPREVADAEHASLARAAEVFAVSLDWEARLRRGGPDAPGAPAGR
jgi:HAD superfamily hydrolase (TIGR01509 family)